MNPLIQNILNGIIGNHQKSQDAHLQMQSHTNATNKGLLNFLQSVGTNLQVAPPIQPDLGGGNPQEQAFGGGGTMGVQNQAQPNVFYQPSGKQNVLATPQYNPNRTGSSYGGGVAPNTLNIR